MRMCTPSRLAALAAALYAASLTQVAGCATTPTPPAAGPHAGPPVGLGAPEVVNRRDFIYALDFGAGGSLAFVHHVSTHMELSATGTWPLAPRFQEKVNASEFDIEDVLVVDAGPAKGSIAVPSRQGMLRAFDGASGAKLREYTAGTALLRVALSPDGTLLVASAADGRVFFFDPATFALNGSARPHTDEVRGLAFLPDGRLVTAGQDAALVVSRIAQGAPDAVRVPTAPLKSGERVFLTHLEGVRAVSTVRDQRQPECAVSSAAVKRLELAMVQDGSQLTAVPATGPSSYPAVELGRVVVGTLDLGALRAAVCDECVPVGAELVLGGEALTRAVLADDVARDELVARVGTGERVATSVAGAVSLVEDKRVPLPGPGTDLDVSAAGAVLVTFSHAKAERSFDLYDAEKHGNYPEPQPASAASLVDVERGTLGRRFIGHRGFTVSGALSPDGRTVATGGWDKRVLVFDAETGQQVAERQLAWLVRRLRFSQDGGTLGVAAWTPVNALNQGDSEPALLLYPLEVAGGQVARAP
ncbi:MAG: hypothetical protein A2138_08510 [Deltaproteobacteria bacterium RBG_16_71_12]|nr:MAG: hypothetical protein A2138_08510 [Deltaproteobacteria bacterium RBG_16_71_12]